MLCGPQISVATEKLPEVERCTELVQCVSVHVCVGMRVCMSLHMSVGTYIGVCTHCRNGCVVLTTCRVDEVYMEAAKCTATLSNLLENVSDAATVNAALAVCQSLSLCALLSSHVHHVCRQPVQRSSVMC